MKTPKTAETDPPVTMRIISSSAYGWTKAGVLKKIRIKRLPGSNGSSGATKRRKSA